MTNKAQSTELKPCRTKQPFSQPSPDGDVSEELKIKRCNVMQCNDADSSLEELFLINNFQRPPAKIYHTSFRFEQSRV